MSATLLMSAGGGHGTVAIKQAAGGYHMMPRPDVSFGGREISLTDYPSAKYRAEFHRRTAGKMDLNFSKTIEEHFVELIEKWSGWILLSGFISGKDPFLYRNGFKAYVVIRHPVDSYVSFMKHRHPEFAFKFWGGSSNVRAIEWYGNFWCHVIKDAILSGSDIFHYDCLEDQSKDSLLGPIVANKWRPRLSGCNWNELIPNLRKILYGIVGEVYERLGYKWVIE